MIPTDGGNKVVWADDVQIKEHEVRQIHGAPGVLVEVWAL